MGKYLGTIVCRRALVDAETRLVSVIDMVDRFQVFGAIEPKAVLLAPIPFAIVTMWRVDPGEPSKIRDRIILANPKGERLTLGQYDYDAEGTSRVVLSMNGLPVAGSGTYTLVVERAMDENGDKWRQLDELNVEVVIAPLPVQEPTAAASGG